MSNKPKNPRASSEDAASLDPYSEFLQLPDGPRPPHLYQLLELEVFCPHPEQIQHAVRKQFRKIKPFEEHSDRTMRARIQEVMTHIATARVVLTTPEQKQAYDEKLAQHLKLDRTAILRERTAARLPEFRLVVTAGSGSIGTRLDLSPDREITIGSASACMLTLTGMRLAEVHARLRFEGDDWVLSAKDALVLVNDERVTSTALAAGDSIDLGGYRLRFEPLDARAPDPGSLPPPLSAVVREGPSIHDPVLNALPPASILIGHCDTALWQLGKSGVSLHHARLESNGPLWEIVDLQSDTGTLLNGEPVTRSILNHRDELTIGRFKIQVRLRR